ncbi:hypothetical protein KAR91_76190 [Candidatus Pacearchaeota archaeon]|nr:hypothetical protein [Candidatus Pacearchaeota archaeon]
MTINTTSNNVSNHEEWIPDLILMTAIGRLRRKILAPELGRTIYDAEAKGEAGEVIYLKERGTGTVRTKTKDNDYEFDSPDGTTNPFGTLVEKHTSFQIQEQLPDILRMGMEQFTKDYLDDYMDKLAEQIDKDLFATYASMSTSSPDTSLDDERMLAIKQVADDAFWLQDNRVILVNPTIENQDILNTTTNPEYNKADNVGNEGAAQAIQKGAVGWLRGFQVYASPQVTTTAGSPTVHQCMAFRKGGIGLISIPQTLNCGKHVIARQVIYQNMAMRFRYWTDPDAGKHKYSFSMLQATGLVDDRLCISVPISKS